MQGALHSLWPRSESRSLSAILLLLAALAWLALAVWGQSPYARYVEHGDGHTALAADGESIGTALIFVIGWTVMTIAMMLPTSLPLFGLFRRLVRQKHDASMLVALLIGGYLVVWTVFGVTAHLADRGIHAVVGQVPSLNANAWILTAVVLWAAGAFQFSRLKYLCLEKCRTPLSFITEHWHGSHERLAAFKLGARHGLFCVGCCWSLMIVMFAVGFGNLVWMFGLSAAMAIEKNMPWGRRISAPLGIALMLSAVGVAAFAVVQTCTHGAHC